MVEMQKQNDLSFQREVMRNPLMHEPIARIGDEWVRQPLAPMPGMFWQTPQASPAQACGTVLAMIKVPANQAAICNATSIDLKILLQSVSPQDGKVLIDSSVARTLIFPSARITFVPIEVRGTEQLALAIATNKNIRAYRLEPEKAYQIVSDGEAWVLFGVGN